MHETVAVLAAIAGAAAAPLLQAVARWAPRVGRPASGADTAETRLSVARRTPLSSPPARGLVAVGGASVLAMLGGRIGADPALVAFVVFGLVGVVLVLVDVATHRLPDVLTLPSYVVGVALLGIGALLGSGTGSFGRALLGAAVGLVVYALPYLLLPSGMGAGDVKYAGVVGLHAGWLGWESLAVALVAGFVVGGLVSVVLLVTGRAGLRSRVPFGPSMVVGALVGIVAGEPLADAWLTW